MFKEKYPWLVDSDFYFQKKMESFERENRGSYSRECTKGHFTASMWILNPSLSHVFLVHHKKLDMWLQPGGHADGDTSLIRVAEKELLEETGFQSHLFLSKDGFVLDSSLAVPFDFDIHKIPEYKGIKKHLHLDICFCVQVDSSQDVLLCEDEVLDGKWFLLENLEKEDILLESRILRMRIKTENFLK